MKSPTPRTRPNGLVLAAALVLPLTLIPMGGQAIVVNPPLHVSASGDAGRGSDSVMFTGRVLISSRIIDDTVFGNPLVLELVIDLSDLKGVTKRLGRNLGTDAQVVVRRPLLPFDQIEVTFPYSPTDDPTTARTASAQIDVWYSAAKGLTFATRIRDF